MDPHECTFYASHQTEVLWLTDLKLQKGLNTWDDQMHRQYGDSKCAVGYNELFTL